MAPVNNHESSSSSSSSSSDASSSSSEASETSDERRVADNLYSVHLTASFTLYTLLLIAAIAFSVGTACRIILLNNSPMIYPQHGAYDTSIRMADQDNAFLMNRIHPMQLPSPTLRNGKVIPHTTFTSKLFLHQKVASTFTSTTVHLDRQSGALASVDQEIEYDVEEDFIRELEDENEDDNEDDSEDKDGQGDSDEDNNNAAELHLPAGHHLLVDIKHVDANFLNSEGRLAQAMVNLIEGSESTLLSYHCHSLVPSGVSCVGVLLKSHVSLHTWPNEGAIILDLFTCGTVPLLPILPLVNKMFGIPTTTVGGGIIDEGRDATLLPTMLWSHKLRGFRSDFSSSYKQHENPLEQDLGQALSWHGMDMMEPLLSEETDYQHVDIFQFIDPYVSSLGSYMRSLSESNDDDDDDDDGLPSYESLHKHLYVPVKVLFLDGVEQSSARGEAAYHEALVHPSMIAHSKPRRVAIIGGGEGATLREVLKHKTVEHVLMVEIDEELVEMCEEYLPEWSDCTDIVGIDADSCFDDSRASVEFEDAFKWFIDRFEDYGSSTDEKFDVIIMDALDPDRLVEIVGSLYKENVFINSLSNALTEEGVLVVQIGGSESIADPPDEMGPGKDTANMMEALHSVFESMHEYDEAHSDFGAPWTYLVCFKDSITRASWYRNAAEIDIELHQRIAEKKSGKPALLFFDAPTMISYQVPSRAKEASYCRKEAKPWECDEYYSGVNPEIANIPVSHVEARKSTRMGEYADRGLFASQDTPESSNLDINGSAKAFHVLPSTWSVIEDLYYTKDDGGVDKGAFAKDKLSSMVSFVPGYGCGAKILGMLHYAIDLGVMTFCNHGCNGMHNIGDCKNEFTEINADLDRPPEAFVNNAPVYSPVFDRHLRQIIVMAMGDYRPIVTSIKDSSSEKNQASGKKG